MFAGLEMVKYSDCFQKAEMHYWQNTAKGSNAEVDYLRVRGGVVLPVEVNRRTSERRGQAGLGYSEREGGNAKRKASTQGAMQSLWIFMRKRGLHEAVRTSLEPFGEFDYVDAEAENAVRHVEVVPLYALSNLRHTPEDYRNMISKETMEAEKR